MMNTIAIVALLAVCACVSADVVLTPHELPCEYAIIAESNSTVSNEVQTEVDTFYIHGTFAAIYTEVTAPKPSFNEVLLRIDLADYQTDEVGDYEVHTEAGDNCTGNMVDRNAALASVDSALTLFRHNSTFDKVSDGTFEGTSCKVYYKKSGNDESYVFVDKDSYIIGFNSTSDSGFVVARVKYEMKAPLDKFVIDNKKYPGCSQYASVTPVVDECTDIKFKGKDLPCEVVIDAVNDYFDSDGQEYKFNDTLMAHGSFKAYIIRQQTPMEYTSQVIVRADVNDSTSEAVYSYHSTQGDQCEGEMVSKGIIDEKVKVYLAMFEDEWIFHAKADGEFMGKKVTMYYTNTNGTELIFFVDKDDLVIGMNTTSTQGTQSSYYTYSWSAPLKLFAMDKSHEGCDDAAYQIPSYDPCICGSGSSGSAGSNAASTVLASFALAAFSVMLALLF